MKMKKLLSAFTAAIMAASMLTVSASALEIELGKGSLYWGDVDGVSAEVLEEYKTSGVRVTCNLSYADYDEVIDWSADGIAGDKYFMNIDVSDNLWYFISPVKAVGSVPLFRNYYTNYISGIAIESELDENELQRTPVRIRDDGLIAIDRYNPVPSVSFDITPAGVKLLCENRGLGFMQYAARVESVILEPLDYETPDDTSNELVEINEKFIPG